MDRAELIKKITEKKEFSDLPRKDVEIAFDKFYKKENPDFQNIKLTRNFLRKIYSSFTSRKLLGLNGKVLGENGSEWVLMKHKSTKERFPFYDEVYSKIFEGYKNQGISVIDLGAGVNGFSFDFLKRTTPFVKYTAVEAIGQLIGLMNAYFERNKMNAKAIKLSLFDLGEVKELILNQKKPRIVLMFKVIDSLESMQRDYSKLLLREIVPLSDKIVVSFATRSLGNRKKFSVQRGWLVKFVKEEFQLEDDFEYGGERYLILKNKR